MEALEDKYTKRDSFDEVDRILTIVEESRERCEVADSTHNNLSLKFSFLLLTTLFSFGFIVNEYFSNYNSWVNIINFKGSTTLLIFCVIIVSLTLFQLNQSIKAKESISREHNTILLEATEVIREIVPALSRSERWSVLQKFELRLRLSRLGISVDKIFEPEM